MSKSNLFESIELVFWLQRIFCILPLKWNGSTELLKTTLLMKLHVYGIIAMILLITYQSIFTWNCADHLRKFLPKGELWTILFSYAFIAIYIHFLLNILYFFINRPKHIEVLKLFHSIDNRFRIKFRQEVNHRKHKRQINIGITLISLYYLFSLISGTIYWYLTDQVVMIPIHFVYDFERVSLHLPTYMSINYILLIRARSEHLLKVYGPLQSKYNNYLKNGGADRIVLNHFSIELDKVIELFKKTCSLFNICIASFGWSNLLQIARLFTSIAMEIYILWTFSMGKTTGGAAVPYFMIYSLFGELVNLGIHTIVLGAAFSTVHGCKYAFRSFDKCGRNPNIRRVCKSFEMWSSKYEIRYSAFNIFDMDAKMYFNMACGVVSALLILTQVQMILDENAAMNARKNNLQ